MMRIFAISDLHGYFPPFIPECELLLLGGDYCPTRNIDQEKRFIETRFVKFLEACKRDSVKRIAGIAGNHDFIFQEDEKLARSLPWTYLKDELLDIDGIKIWGTPWSKQFYNWAFMQAEVDLKPLYAPIPKGLDILLTHGPAVGRLDKNIGGEHCGSWALLDKIKDVKPDTVVCGHIHEAHGILDEDGVRYYNVSYLNAHYEPKYNCINIPLKVPNAS
jgi:Icc-related predicted phosphoesterase